MSALRQRKTLTPARSENLAYYDIIQADGAEYRGIVGYYMLARDVWRFNELE
jgi:hypothetical protein